MSTPVTEVDEFTASIPTPVNGDKRTYPATITTALTGLASRAKWLKNTLDGATGSTTTLNSANTGVFAPTEVLVPTTVRGNIIYQLAYNLISLCRFIRRSVWGATEATAFLNVPVTPVGESDGGATQVTPGTYWTFSGASDVLAWNQASVAGAVRTWWYIDGLPPSGKINLIGCYLDGASGHGGVMPTTKPVLSLFRHVAGQAPALVAAITDPTSSAATYEAEHLVALPDLAETIQQNCKYFFRLEGETGGSAVTGLKITQSYIGITSA